ncbi:pLS20_p028 family conjugation system transmembrane protein [Vagococcus xieshaowenii]|uniref:DUF8208 domain-containing protein n=1 Tax=Vagococcus xieshaowenii TaxID=2562451 RepID=A0AAJ5JLL7_9ENTE|nr:hypothetical protein [Vagococcus xieshaowenii]QCA29682.1 hypothetical protein E4Z98_09860 [Vagococcus xieshaowenii]TFZ42957.1 hypothetical protein E4031_01600 [Vagococcus xieshaowenii]
MTDVFKILKEYRDYLDVSNFFASFFRMIGWLILQLFKGLVDAMDGLLNQVYKLVEFPMSNGVTQFVEDYRFAIYGIGSVCLIWFFIRYANNRNLQIKGLLDNVILGVLVVVTSSVIISTLTTGTFEVAKSIYSGTGSTSSAIFNENIVDTLSFDTQGWPGADDVQTINLNKTQLSYLDITQEIDASKAEFSSDVSKKVFSNRVENNASNQLEMVKLESGLFKIDQHYYRYSWHPWIIFFQLVISFFILFLATFKYLQAIYNIAFNSVILPFFAFSDVVEGSKVKKIIQGIINTLINVLLFAVSMKVYRLFSNYLGTADINGLVKVAIQLILVVIIIEGPWIIQELTGQEGGLKSSVGRAMALGGAMKAVGIGAAFTPSVANRAKNAVENAANSVRNKSSLLAGMSKGALNEVKGDLDVKQASNEAKSSEVNKPNNDDLAIKPLSEEEKMAAEESLLSPTSDGQDQPLTKDLAVSEGNSEAITKDDMDTSKASEESLNPSLDATEGTNENAKGLTSEESKELNQPLSDAMATKQSELNKPSAVSQDNTKEENNRLNSELANNTQESSATDLPGNVGMEQLAQQQEVSAIKEGLSPKEPQTPLSAQNGNKANITPNLIPSQAINTSAPMARVPSATKVNPSLSIPKPSISDSPSVRMSAPTSLQGGQPRPSVMTPQQVTVPSHIANNEGKIQLSLDSQSPRPISTTQSMQSIRADRQLEKSMMKVERARERQVTFDVGQNTGKEAVKFAKGVKQLFTKQGNKEG